LKWMFGDLYKSGFTYNDFKADNLAFIGDRLVFIDLTFRRIYNTSIQDVQSNNNKILIYLLEELCKLKDDSKKPKEYYIQHGWVLYNIGMATDNKESNDMFITILNIKKLWKE